MKGVILAGGLGTRLYPVTREIPKALIPIQGKPLTDHVFDIFHRAGVSEVILSLGYLHDSILERYTPQFQGSLHGTNYSLSTSWVRDRQNGTAAWIKKIQEANLELSDTFIVVNGDNLCSVDFASVLDFHHSRQAQITIVLKELEDISGYGVAELEGEKIKRFVEKPEAQQAPSKYISTGYYVFSRSVLADVEHFFSDANLGQNQSWSVMLEHDIFPYVASQGGLYGFPCQDLWFDTGTFERWNQVIDQWTLNRGSCSGA